MLRFVAILLVTFQLAPPVLLGGDACVTEVDDRCHVERADGSHVDAHEGHAPAADHDDLGRSGTHPDHACGCVCHTPIVLGAPRPLATVATVVPVPADTPDAPADGHRAPPFHPPRRA